MMKRNTVQTVRVLGIAFLFFIFHFSFQSVSAQVGSSFQTNMFFSGKGGAVLYNNDNGNAFGFGGGLYLGKWISEPMALRAGFEVVSVPCRDQTPDGTASLHFMASIDAIWDLWTAFGNGPQDWYLRVYPMLGIGGLLRGEPNDDGTPYNVFQMSVGIHAPFSLSRYSKWAGFLEYRLYCLPEGYDANQRHATLQSVSLGFTRRFNRDPYHRRTATESRAVRDDWFAGAAIGANYSAFDLFTNPNSGGTAMIGVAPEIMVGRNYSNFWTLRFEFTGLTAHEAFDTLSLTALQYRFTYFHADVMVNLTHAINFKRGVKWNALPYVGVGPIWRYDKMNLNMAGTLGLMMRRYLNESGDFFIDAKYVMVPPSIGGGRGPSKSIYRVGIPSITVGYLHNFGITSTRYRLPASFSNECVY